MAYPDHSSDIIDLSLPADREPFDSWIIGICSSMRSRGTADIQQSGPRKVQTPAKALANDRHQPADLQAHRASQRS